MRQDGVAFQAAPLQEDPSDLLQAGHGARPRWDGLGTHQPEVGAREGLASRDELRVREHEPLLGYPEQGPEGEPFAPGALVGELEAYAFSPQPFALVEVERRVVGRLGREDPFDEPQNERVTDERDLPNHPKHHLQCNRMGETLRLPTGEVKCMQVL